MSNVEFEENNSYDSDTLQKRFRQEAAAKQRMSPIYTRLFLGVIIICFSVSIFILFRAFHAETFNSASFSNQYEKPVP